LIHTRVSTQDVDVNSLASVQRFHAKLASIAKANCDSHINTAEVIAADKACARQALNDAVAHLNQPMLTAINNTATPVLLAQQ
jgi:UrcA family protein